MTMMSAPGQTPPSITTPTSPSFTVDEAIRKCRAAGKAFEYDQVIQTAEIAINLMQKIEDEHKHCALTKRQHLQKASITGYLGFALFKKEKYSESLQNLEESKKLRDNIKEQYMSNEISEQRQRVHDREAEAVEDSLKQCYLMLGQAPPLPSLIKYPRTTHLFDAGGTATTVDDLVLPGLDMILPIFCNGQNQVIIEEKIDGSNLGISLCPYTGQILVQNRSHYISQGDHAQYNRIPQWVEEYQEVLTTSILKGGDRILYGEWVTARHSIPYKKLPAYFIAFDIYDKKTEKFLSRSKFHSILKYSGIPAVPVIQTRTFGPYNNSVEACQREFRHELIQLLDSLSTFRSDGGTVEGVVLRVDDSTSSFLDHKFKVVRPDFVGGCQTGHWATRQVEKQMVDFDFAVSYLDSCYPFAVDHDDAP